MPVSVSTVIKAFQNRAGKSEFLLSYYTFLIKKDQEKYVSALFKFFVIKKIPGSITLNFLFAILNNAVKFEFYLLISNLYVK